jgi:hypothetical protein
LFRQILQEVDVEDREDAVKLLQWALFSQAPLTLDELQHALAFHSETAPTSVIEWKTSEDYQTLSSFENRVRDLSRGLIELRERKDETINPLRAGPSPADSPIAISPKQIESATSSYGVQFIHETVREFFSANDYRIPRQLHDRVVPNFEIYSHNLLMLSCLRYIAAKDLRRDAKSVTATSRNVSAFHQKEEVLAHSTASSFMYTKFAVDFSRDLLVRYPFFHYAISYFPHHARLGDCDSEEVRRFDIIDRLISENGSLRNFILSTQLQSDQKEGEDCLFCNGLLQFFARRGSHVCVSKLLDLGWNPNMRGVRTPLQAACEGGHGDVAELLIERGANVNSVHSHRSWLLGWEADVLRTLLSRGLEVDRRTVSIANEAHSNGTLLHGASGKADWRKVEVLLEAGADVNAQNVMGSTPLHLVHFLKVLKVLLDHGANTELQDLYGLTAQDYAEMRLYGDLVRIFQDHRYAQQSETRAHSGRLKRVRE